MIHGLLPVIWPYFTARFESLSINKSRSPGAAWINETLYEFCASRLFSDSIQVIDSNDYFHIEMFVALPGKQKELLAEREMENKYLQDLNRPTNLIFTKLSGGSYDIFTIGGYRSIKHFAESADIPFEDEDEAAKKAGFEGVNFIGSYLRSLISSHHDTLATKVNIENWVDSIQYLVVHFEYRE